MAEKKNQEVDFTAADLKKKAEELAKDADRLFNKTGNTMLMQAKQQCEFAASSFGNVK